VPIQIHANTRPSTKLIAPLLRPLAAIKTGVRYLPADLKPPDARIWGMIGWGHTRTLPVEKTCGNQNREKNNFLVQAESS
jgi:hypothetical protein